MLAELKVGNFASVISLADIAFKFCGIVDSDRFKAHRSRGVTYHNMGIYCLATMDLFYALKLSPDDSVTKARLRTAEQRSGFDGMTKFPLATVSVHLQDGDTLVWIGDPRLIQGLRGWGRLGTVYRKSFFLPD